MLTQKQLITKSYHDENKLKQHWEQDAYTFWTDANKSELKSGDRSTILFLILAIIPHIISGDSTNQPNILTGTFFSKNECLFKHWICVGI